MKSRSELREKIMVILYQIDINRSQHIDYNVEEIISSNLDIDNEFVRDIVYGVITISLNLLIYITHLKHLLVVNYQGLDC